MGYQWLARQEQRHAVPGLAGIERKKGCKLAHIDECDIAYIEPHGLIVMDHGGAASDMEDREVMVRAIEANIAVGSLDSLGIGAHVGGNKPVYTEGTHPTRKGARFDAFGIETAT